MLTGRPPVNPHFLLHMTESSVTYLVNSLHYALLSPLTSIKSSDSVTWLSILIELRFCQEIHQSCQPSKNMYALISL